MAKDKADKLEEKKKELQSELEKIQHELDDSLDKVRGDVSSSLDPAEFIKKHPLPVVGVSIVIGFLAGHKKKKSSGDSDDDGLSSVLFYELKRLATKKGISVITDYVEKLFMDRVEDVLPMQNGTAEKE